ncbi:MAG: hypothetical protein QNK04_33805 [Myxococcota bacterium]|nr:hypothetical protein [Myxococcota bacterium]
MGTFLVALASVALALAPWPFVWIPLLWSAFFVHRAARVEGPGAKIAWINAAGLLAIFAAAEGVLQLRPSLELSGLPDDYFQGHETLGYAPLASSRATATRTFAGQVLYEVAYTIDAAGLRVAPPVAEGGGAECLLFFGGSFIFGEGVNDEEALPYQVGVATQGRFRVYNFGFHGYGPHQMLAALEDDLVAATLDCTPHRAVYLALPDHVIRAAGFRSWDVHGPRYALQPGGGVAYAGHFDDGAAFYWRSLLTLLERSKLLATLLAWRRPDPDEAERLFLGIVVAARDQIETRHPGAEFHVIFWDDADASLARRLRAAGVRLHPIDEIVPPGERAGPAYTIPRDGHPTAQLHESVADYVAREIVGDGASRTSPAHRAHEMSTEPDREPAG